MFQGPVAHVGGPIMPAGEITVLIGHLAAARVGDFCFCEVLSDQIAQGSTTVLIGGAPAARLLDPTIHGGTIISGCPTVLIGQSGQGAALSAAAESGAALCEIPPPRPPSKS
jgi:uncharacterized Zn-binding protein involved in type VI secretion